MKAIIKANGNIIDVKYLYSEGGVRYYQSINGKHTDRDLDFNVNKKNIDWEERRYEIARDVLPSIINPNTSVSEDVRFAVVYADNLIAELQRRF